MHLPNALRERLMDLASSSVCPSLPASRKPNNFQQVLIFIEKAKFSYENVERLTFKMNSTKRIDANL